MINSISWASYWYAISLSLGAYYLAIILLYFRGDIKGILAPKSQPVLRKSRDNQVQNINPNLTCDQQQEFELPGLVNNTGAEALLDEINAFFQQIGEEVSQKEKIIAAVQIICRKYPQIENSEYRLSIENVIVNASKNYCAVTLDEDEVGLVWKW